MPDVLGYYVRRYASVDGRLSRLLQRGCPVCGRMGVKHVLFIFVLRTNGGEVPTIRFVDYQVVSMVQPTLYEGRSLADSAWGGTVKERLDKALA